MRITCAWCLKRLSDKAPFYDYSVSHTICEDCSKKEVERIMKKVMIDDEGFVAWLDKQTYDERYHLRELWSMREDLKLSWEDFLYQRYLTKGE